MRGAEGGEQPSPRDSDVRAWGALTGERHEEGLALGVC